QALKAVADFPRVTYLLAYDVNVIERSLDPQQDLSRGRSYLEKIVQISYPIPPAFPWQQRIYISKAINELLIQHRINLKTFESDRFDEAVSVAIKITRQPRDVIRLINRLNLSLPATRNEVSVCDLIVFESICLKFPEFRHALVNCPEDFIGHRFSDDDTDSSFEDWSEFLSERKDKDTDWTRHFPPEKRDNPDVLKACYFLFPYISGNRNTNLKDHLRIAVRDRLIRLFSLTAMDNIPNVVELNSLLQNPSELESAFDVDPVNYQTLLSWLDQYAGSIDLRDVDSPIASLITIFWRQVNSYAVENAALKSIVNYGLLEKYISLIAQLIRKAEQGKRVDLFKLIISTAPLSLSERFVLMAAQQHGLWPVDPNRMLPDELKLMEDQKAAIEMIQVWCEKVFEIALPDEPDELLKEPHLHSVLYRWLQLGKDPAMVFSTVKKICSSEKGLEKFVIDYSNEQSLDHDNNFGLVWDANELAVLIQRNKTLKVTHSKYVGMLRSESVINYLNERNKKLFQNLAK
ncbi:MAG: P-loop NTPase fold protein, partial [Burkholderiaceae bacterium]